ncbi:MAG: N-acetylglucosamine kinase [Dysgonamonadaceae bacterium]|jgi:N-acetylglucosamine kinase-like BadF-type ATPase|nr:N-acetylglucosamine kinase [Dysgonamonadaceae bacterium]
MILIADSGGSKTSWCLIDEAGKTTEFTTEGYNPCYTGSDKLPEMLQPNLPPDFDLSSVTTVAFYGAGVYDDNHEVVVKAIRSVFPNAAIEAAMDLVGSARSLLGRHSGFAAILGTGTNSCIYDGQKITHYIDSLGFLLGDEGSGAYMGKKLIGEYIRGYMPEAVQQVFRDTYRLTNDELIIQLYGHPTPNSYCASFTRFLTGPLAGHDYLEQHIIRDSFRDFFRNIVSRYPDYSSYTFNCVGSIGWIFRNALSEVAQEFRMKIGNIIQSPIEGLVRYHRESLV